VLVLGIDPGSTATGYGFVSRQRGRYRLHRAGVLRTRSKDPMPERLALIHDGLAALLIEHGPQACAIEAIFRHKSSESALRLGQARGVAMLALGRGGLPVYEYNAMTVKKTVTGSGRADKHQVRRMVETLLGQTVEGPHDAVDAVAIAMTHLVHAPRLQALEQRR